MIEVGQIIGDRFRVERVIGVGGFGVVVQATHLELRTNVAIKMLKDEFAADTEILERFLREARAVATLHTEHVCRVLDVARLPDGAPYIVMEMLDGTDVASIIRKTGPLSLATAIDYVRQACIGLADAHARAIIHRDLKPANLFVTRRPDSTSILKVLDFGIAKAADELRLTHSAAVLGSPQFMSPEQLMAPRTVDARTDIWSLGVTLYQMLTRRLPFPSAQMGELAVMITSQPPAPAELDPAVHAVILRCLEKDPAHRFPDVHALSAALASIVVAPRVSSPPSMPSPPMDAPTAISVSAAPAAMPAPVPAPMPGSSLASQRRGWLIPAGALLVVGAAVGTYFVVRKSTTTTKVAETKQVVVVDAGPTIEHDAPLASETPIKPEMRKEFEDAIKTLEAELPRTTDPVTLEKYYAAIGTTACALRDVAKARFYFTKTGDTNTRERIRHDCAAYGIAL